MGKGKSQRGRGHFLWEELTPLGIMILPSTRTGYRELQDMPVILQETLLTVYSAFGSLFQKCQIWKNICAMNFKGVTQCDS